MIAPRGMSRSPARWTWLCIAGTLVGCHRERAMQMPHSGGTPSAVCGECHGAIYKEWKQSAHAAAYTREEFRLATKDHTEAGCMACHIPVSLEKLNGTPVRTEHKDEGVNCESCHLIGDAYAAPKRFSSYADHKIVENDLLVKSDFCGQCHEAIFRQWSDVTVGPDERKTCQECHMPAVPRRTVSGSLWHILHPKVDCRRHEFAMIRPKSVEKHVEMNVTLDEASTETVAGKVELTNTGAQHSLPSGEFGFREIAVVTALVDRYGVASAKQVERFVAQRRHLLPYGKPQTVQFRFDTVPSDADAIEVRLVRSSFAGVEAIMAKHRGPLRPSRSARGQTQGVGRE